ncbi:hypothetical protein SOASR031_27190 [Leminorella grimontii]|nr:hypothetical protein SOASR031_27190 [Leminorella grimontii]
MSEIAQWNIDKTTHFATQITLALGYSNTRLNMCQPKWELSKLIKN